MTTKTSISNKLKEIAIELRASADFNETVRVPDDIHIEDNSIKYQLNFVGNDVPVRKIANLLQFLADTLRCD